MDSRTIYLYSFVTNLGLRGVDYINTPRLLLFRWLDPETSNSGGGPDKWNVTVVN